MVLVVVLVRGNIVSALLVYMFDDSSSIDLSSSSFSFAKFSILEELMIYFTSTLPYDLVVKLFKASYVFCYGLFYPILLLAIDAILIFVEFASIIVLISVLL